MAIYPSTVYRNQPICFEVFTDQVSDLGVDVITSVKIGGNTADLVTHSYENEEDLSKTSSYQQCAMAGSNIASFSQDITLMSRYGKYKISEFAKSFDGTNSYLVKTVPRINGISHDTINTIDGSIITISGEGFSSTPSENVVSIGGND